jgi:hypothetical protein
VLKIVLIWGVGLTLFAVVMGILVIVIEHIQYKSKQSQYDDLHSKMGLNPDDTPIDPNDQIDE